VRCWPMRCALGCSWTCSPIPGTPSPDAAVLRARWPYRFLSEATIAETTVNEESVSLEEVIELRRLREEQRERVRQRAEELFNEALSNEQHASDVRELTEVIGKLGTPADSSGESGAGARGDGKENALGVVDGAVVASMAAVASKLDAIAFSAKSYPSFGAPTDEVLAAALDEGASGMPSEEAAVRALREETHRLRMCLARGKHSDAFRGYVEETVQPARTATADAAAAGPFATDPATAAP